MGGMFVIFLPSKGRWPTTSIRSSNGSDVRRFFSASSGVLTAQTAARVRSICADLDTAPRSPILIASNLLLGITLERLALSRERAPERGCPGGIFNGRRCLRDCEFSDIDQRSS